MKFKTTSKAIRNGYGTKFLFKTGFYNLQTLLRGLEPVAYTCGVYGWNYDLYDIEGVGITTGYRGMVGNQIPIELIKKYENAAKEVLKKYDWREYSKEFEKLRKEFIKELLKKEA